MNLRLLLVSLILLGVAGLVSVLIWFDDLPPDPLALELEPEEILERVYERYADLDAYYGTGVVEWQSGGSALDSVERTSYELFFVEDEGYLFHSTDEKRSKHGRSSERQSALWLEDGVGKLWTRFSNRAPELKSHAQPAFVFLGPLAAYSNGLSSFVFPLLFGMRTSGIARLEEAVLSPEWAILQGRECFHLEGVRAGDRGHFEVWIDAKTYDLVQVVQESFARAAEAPPRLRIYRFSHDLGRQVRSADLLFRPDEEPE